ncbi:MAG: amidophosphoribosyltransferase [Deltaproteobacteria bacterium HGW-Deltaproteobacteria-4]|nr:MAG: amidophosphoribosyltransferase [Deltaproteobacteria bacterium HGW-Deltaproteobacteria-4]
MIGSGFYSEVKNCFDLFFPPLCLLCHAPRGESPDPSLCSCCLDGFLPVTSPCCPRCALPFATIGGGDHVCGECLLQPPDFSWTVAAGLYEEALRHAIHRFKFDGRIALDRPLAGLLETIWQRTAPAWIPDLIVPVPLHPHRLSQRTYNQSLLIARELGRRRQLPVDSRLLIRILPTVAQAGLTARERHNNLRGAFALTRPLAGEKVLLIDDVMTTGTTARICATVLHSGGAGEVALAVLARARRNSMLGLETTLRSEGKEIG